MNRVIFAAFALMVLASPTHAAMKADEVRVDKSDRLLLLYKQRTLIKAYRISLGPHPVGNKMQVADGRTPEGRFRIEAMDPSSKFYMSISASALGASAPAAAAAHAPTNGAVVIHGQRPALKPLSPIMKRLDWTDGSIALSNGDMDELWGAIGPGTLLSVEP
jgi:murein L,D-transpeptidase YafK